MVNSTDDDTSSVLSITEDAALRRRTGFGKPAHATSAGELLQSVGHAHIEATALPRHKTIGPCKIRREELGSGTKHTPSQRAARRACGKRAVTWEPAKISCSYRYVQPLWLANPRDGNTASFERACGHPATQRAASVNEVCDSSWKEIDVERTTTATNKSGTANSWRESQQTRCLSAWSI
jgi:hypothetical protein